MSSFLPTVDVVITLHNGAAWIQDTLDAVRSQSHPPAEILVVDDHSTDDGPALAASIPGVTVMPLPTPSRNSPAPGRRLGFERTTSPFVAFLDQDDLWHPDHLRLLATTLAEHPSAPAALSLTRPFLDGHPPSYDAPRLAPAPVDLWTHFPLSPIWTPSSVLVRRTALDAIGGWPTVGPITDFLTWFHLSTRHPFIENRSTTCAYRRHLFSHSTDTNSRHRATYLQYMADVLAPLIPERARFHPAPTDRLQIRLNALRACGLLVAAYDTGTSAPLSEATPALERLAKTEPAFFDRLVTFLFRYFLEPSFTGPPEEQIGFLDRLLATWPPSAPESKRHLETLFVPSLSMWAFLAFLRHNPFHWYRWSLVISAARWRLQNRWTRLRGAVRRPTSPPSR
jgi:glycosyltransferase involved in cell wall biosynthesis